MSDWPEVLRLAADRVDETTGRHTWGYYPVELRTIADHIERLEAVAEAAGALFTLGGQMHPMTAEDGSTLAELVLPADYEALRAALAALGEGPTKA